MLHLDPLHRRRLRALALVRGAGDPAFDIIEKPRPARIKPNTTAPGKMKYEPPPLPDEATA
jgi:hypothetical protein